MKFRLKVTILLTTVIIISSMARAETGQDLHQRWHNHCFVCHGHSAEFSRKYLTVVDGKLQGRQHVHNLRQFLHNHYLSGREVDAIYNMLLAQASTEARFMSECSRCHETAVEFIRDKIMLREGVLYSRVLESPIHNLLNEHRNMTAEDIEFYMKLLTRIANEVYRQLPE